MRVIVAALTSSCAAWTCPAIAQERDDLPPFSVAVRDALDVWSVPTGLFPGSAILNKFQVSATLNGDSIGAEGWSAHAQIFRFDGEQLSNRIGDIQTSDNIEAVPLTRLFEAWIARQWGGKKSSDRASCRLDRPQQPV